MSIFLFFNKSLVSMIGWTVFWFMVTVKSGGSALLTADGSLPPAVVASACIDNYCEGMCICFCCSVGQSWLSFLNPRFVMGLWGTEVQRCNLHSKSWKSTANSSAHLTSEKQKRYSKIRKWRTVLSKDVNSIFISSKVWGLYRQKVNEKRHYFINNYIKV